MQIFLGCLFTIGVQVSISVVFQEFAGGDHSLSNQKKKRYPSLNPNPPNGLPLSELSQNFLEERIKLAPTFKILACSAYIFPLKQ